MCTGYVVFNATAGIDWTESVKANGAVGGQQRDEGSGKQLEYGRAHATH